MVVKTTITTVAATSTSTTAPVVMALLLVLVLRRYAEPVPVVQQVRAHFDVRFHLFVVLAGQVRADRGFPAGGGATDAVDAHHLICTCCCCSAAIQSIRFTSLFVVLFHVG